MAELSSRVAAAFRRPAAEQDTTVPDPHSHRLLPHHRQNFPHTTATTHRDTFVH